MIAAIIMLNQSLPIGRGDTVPMNKPMQHHGGEHELMQDVRTREIPRGAAGLAQKPAKIG